MHSKSNCMAWTLALLLPLAAAGEDTTSKTVITAGFLEYDYKRSIAMFEKDVVVEDQQIRIESDRLTVMFDTENDLKSVTAVGNVRVRNEDREAVCDRAVYLAKTGEVILTGDARISRGKDSVSGQRITFWIDDERVLCEPGRLVVFPGKSRGLDLKSELRGGQPGAAPAGEGR